METKQWSKAFTAYKNNFVDVLNNMPGAPRDENGSLVYRFKNFETHQAKNSEFKESSFILSGENDAVRFVINAKGTFVGAAYMPKDSKEVWCGKDLEKISSFANSEIFKSILERFNWSKVSDKTKDVELA